MPSQKTKIDEILDNSLAEGVTAGGSPDLEHIVSQAATTHGVPEALIHAVIEKESRGKVNAKSQVGASGLMQLMPATAKALGVKNINDPVQNINGGTAYLKQLHDQFGSWDLALAAYNAGPTNVRKYGGIPPFKETTNYVNTIMNKVGDVPAPGSSIDNILDDAGVPPLDPAAPMQEGASSPGVPQTEGDREAPGGLVDLITGHRPALMSSQVGAPETLAASKSFLDALGVGALSRLGGKTDTGKKFSENFNNGIDILKSLVTRGDISGYTPKKVEQRAREVQPIIEEAQKEHPVYSGAGTIAGILAPTGASNLAGKALGAAAKAIPGAAKATKSAPLVIKLVNLLTQGAVQGGTYEAVSNPNATTESVKQAATVGAATSAIMAPVLALAKSATKGFGNALINFATKTNRPEVAEYITKYIGPSLTKASLVEKNEKVLKTTEDLLQNHLTKLDAAGNAGVDMRKIAQDPGLLKSLESLDNVEERAQVTKLLNKLAKYEEKGNITLQDANQLKRDLYKQSNFNTKSDKFNLAQFQKSVALNIKSAIEDASGSSKVRELNQKLQNGIELNNAVEASESPNRLRVYMEIGTAIAQPATIPAIAAERFLTSTPGATLVGSAATKVSEATSPHIQTLLNTLVPQANKKNLTNKGK